MNYKPTYDAVVPKIKVNLVSPPPEPEVSIPVKTIKPIIIIT